MISTLEIDLKDSDTDSDMPRMTSGCDFDNEDLNNDTDTVGNIPDTTNLSKTSGTISKNDYQVDKDKRRQF